MESEKFYPIDKSYFQYHIKLLTRLGAWNVYKGKKYWLYNCYSMIYTPLWFALRVIGWAIRGWQTKDNLLPCTLSFTICAAVAGALVKVIILIVYKEDIIQIMSDLHWDRYTASSPDVAIYRSKILTAVVKFTRIFTNAWRINGFLCIASLTYADNEDVGWTLDASLSLVLFKSWLQDINFWVLCVYDFLAYVHLTDLLINHDCFLLGLMIHTTVQLKILNYRLKHCCDTITDEDIKKLKSENSKITQFECILQKTTRKDPNQELITCIQHYQHIDGAVKMVKKVFGFVLLMQLFASVVMMSLMGFQFLVAKTVDFDRPIKAISLILLFNSIFTETLILCWSGDTIISESNYTSCALYQALWYEKSRKFKNNALTFLTQITRPLVVTAFDTFALSAITFKNIMTKSYSAVAVLKKVDM